MGGGGGRGEEGWGSLGGEEVEATTITCLKDMIHRRGISLFWQTYFVQCRLLLLIPPPQEPDQAGTGRPEGRGWEEGSVSFVRGVFVVT